MRFWPFNSSGGASAPPESATDLATARLIDQVRLKPPADAASLGLVEAAATLVESCMASALVSGDGARLLPPQTLGLIGRSLALKGEAVAVLSMDNAALLVAVSHDVSGPAEPSRWRYKVDLSGPSGTETRQASAAEVLHFRRGVSSAEPWRGRSGTSIARTTAQAASAAERAVATETAAPVLAAVSIRDRMTPSQLGEIGQKLASRTNAQRWAAFASGTTVQPVVRPDPAEGLREARREAGLELAESMGVPGSLLTPSTEGMAAREALRRFAATTLRAMAALIEAEIAVKVQREVSVRFDLTALEQKARAAGQLGKLQDVSSDRALELAGL